MYTRWIRGPLSHACVHSNFQDYVKDLIHFSKVVLPAIQTKRVAAGGLEKGDGVEALGAGGAGERIKLSVVGHSMGGLMAVNAALEDPLLFSGVSIDDEPSGSQYGTVRWGGVAWVWVSVNCARYDLLMPKSASRL